MTSFANELVLNTAATVFETHRYKTVDLALIAQETDVSIAELQAVYGDSHRLGVAIYQQSHAQLLSHIRTQDERTIGQRYHAALDWRLEWLDSHTQLMSGLLAEALLPMGTIQANDLTGGTRDSMMQVFEQLINQPTASPMTADDESLLYLMYTSHFLLMILWAYDRTADKQACRLFAQFLGEAITIVRPLFAMPIFRKALDKLVKILMLVFGGARLVDPDTAI